MKDTSKIVGIIALVALIGFIMIACSKGGGRASPVSDFQYELADDGNGICISGYTGKGGKVIIPSTIEGLPVTVIKYRAFVGQSQSEYYPANNITEVVIPNSVVAFGGNAFYWIENLKKVTLPDDLKILPESSFGDCINLTTINLPANLVEIQSAVFQNCGELVNLTIPSSLTAVKFSAWGVGNAFKNCKKLPIKTRQTIESWGYKGGF